MIKKTNKRNRKFYCRLIAFPEMSKKETKKILRKIKKLSKGDLEIVKKIKLKIGVKNSPYKETTYLLSSNVNKENLLKSIEEHKNSKLKKVSIKKSNEIILN